MATPTPTSSLATGIRGPEILVRDAWLPEPLRYLPYEPKSQLGRAIKDILRFLPDTPEARFAAAELIDRASSCVVIESALYGVVRRGALWLANQGGPAVEDHGLMGTKVVTNNGVGFIVDSFQNLKELENQKFHALGTGSGAEAAADSALGTELTTEYGSGNTRATGTTTEAAANIYQTVATNTLDGTPGAALREHGILDQAATGGGVLLDRTVYAAITLVSSDSLETDYRLTFTAGS